MRQMIWGAMGLAVLLLQGCGNSDNEAPRVKAESAFSCDQVNNLRARGDTKSANRMIQASIGQLNAAYTEDKAVQRFYRGLVQKNLDYAYQFYDAIEKSCLATPNQGLNEAATAALNSVYSQTSKQPRWATCRFFNDKSIKPEDVYAEIGNPKVITIGGDAAARNIVIAANSEKYGKTYLLKGVTERCAANPDSRLWMVFGAVGGVAVEEISAEERRVQAEQDAERRRAQHAENLAEYGVDLVAANGATCRRFDMALRLASGNDEPERFREAAHQTLQSLAQQLPTYQRVVFDAEFRKDAEKFTSDVRDQCSGWGGRENLIDALREVNAIKFARTEGQQFFDKLRVEKEGAAGCSPGDCMRDMQARAVMSASVSYERCERGERGGNLVCLPEPRNFYDYALATAYVDEADRRLGKIAEQEKRIPGELLMSRELEECKQKLIAAGYRDPQYGPRVESDCIGPLTAALRAPLEESRGKLESTRQKWAEVAQKLQALATP